MSINIHRLSRIKVNKLDALLIVVGILLLGGFYVFFRREIAYINVRLKITNPDALYAQKSPGNEYAASFLKGDIERDEIGRIVAEILNVDSYRIQADQRVIYLDIKLRTTYNPRKKVYSLMGKSIVFGESFTFNFSKVRFTGLVVDFPGFRDSEGEKKVSVIVDTQVRYDNRTFSDVYGIPDFLADNLRVGDKVYNSEGDILAEILSIRKTPAKRTVVSNTGVTYAVNDPELKDIYMSVRLLAKEVQGEFYMFDYIPVKIGQAIPLNFSHIDIFPVITDLPQEMKK